MPEDDRTRRIPRREFLRRASNAAITGGVLAGIGGAIYGTKKLAENTLMDPHYDFPYSGDPSRAMTLADVKAEYANVYDQLYEAKCRAEAENKTLRVVMGELHDMPRSYIHSLIVCDVAIRLGITDCVVEQPKEGFAELTQNCESIRDSRTKIFQAHSFINPNLRPHEQRIKELGATPHKNLLPYMHSIVNLGTETENILKKDPENTNACPSQATTFTLCGGRVHCGDPERSGPNGEKRDRHEPIVENAMADSVAQVPRHCIAKFGASHLPFIVDKLRERDDTVLVAFDITNSHKVATGASGRPSKRWPEKLQKLKDEGLVQDLKLDCREPSYGKVVEMVMKASLDHRCEPCHGRPAELDSKTAAFVQSIWPHVFEDARVSAEIKIPQKGR